MGIITGCYIILKDFRKENVEEDIKISARKT